MSDAAAVEPVASSAATAYAALQSDRLRRRSEQRVSITLTRVRLYEFLTALETQAQRAEHAGSALVALRDVLRGALQQMTS